MVKIAITLEDYEKPDPLSIIKKRALFSHVFIPFSHTASQMNKGIKTATSRTEKYGKVGDYFDFGN